MTLRPPQGGPPNANPLRRAAFVDRDGTIIVERHYLADPAGVSLVPGAADALIRLKAMGLALVLVTNQSGIGRGLYGIDDYRRVAAEVERQLAAAGVAMDGVYYCPDAPGGDPSTTCRKPSTLMHRAAARDLGLVTRGSFYVGDKISDVEPARALGGTGILVRTGWGREEEPLLSSEFRVVDDLAAAADLVGSIADRLRVENVARSRRP